MLILLKLPNLGRILSMCIVQTSYNFKLAVPIKVVFFYNSKTSRNRRKTQEEEKMNFRGTYSPLFLTLFSVFLFRKSKFKLNAATRKDNLHSKTKS